VRIPIRTKLAGALAVPLVALVGVAAYEVARADSRAQEASEETALATAAVGPGSVISQLQEERNFTLVEQLGMTSQLTLQVSSYEEARGNTDAARAELEEFVASRGGEVARAFEAGLEAINTDLEALRAEVDAVPPEARGLGNVDFAQGVYTRFATIIDALIDDTAGIALDVDDGNLRTGVELITLATVDLENSAEISRGIFSQLLSGGSLETARLNVSERLSTFNVNRDKILDRSVGPYERLPEEYLLTATNREQNELYRRFVSAGEADVEQLTAALSSDEVPGIVQLRAEVARVLQGEADAIVDDANQQEQLAMGLGVAMVAAALFIILAASRSITSPLRSLTNQAERMASESLPSAVQQVLDTPLGEDVVVPQVSPISVRTRDEVSDVASALNTVQGSALDLAVEQAALRKNIADSFVNLGRRNQNLLDRQLEFITDLEREEQEPERLEGLFRLDHLATRMRRNAESLLRLAGGSDSTQTGWGGPVPIVDVVRGALGEVEGYDRVDVRTLPPITVSAAAGADLAHAVAELVENALSFSPPHERVEIRGRVVDDGAYVLAIIDQGVGMNEEQIEAANRRLAGKESFTVAPSRYLGHYVAGHLASTHGIGIRLVQEPAGGITARLDVPASLIIGTAPAGPVADRAPEFPPAPPIETPRPIRMGAPVEYRPAPDEAEPTDDGGWDEPEDAPAARTEPMAAPSTPFQHVSVGSVPDFTTPGGLARRVRGANAPAATNVAAAFGGEAAPAVSSADDVASFLSAFSGGVERGLSEAHHEEEDQ
jgi:signal transduction histidine kinase